MSGKTTRGEFLRAAGAGAAWIALGGALGGAVGCEPAAHARAKAAAAPAGGAWAFRTRPDLKPPAISVSTPPARSVAPGLVFCAPKNGPEEAGPGQDGCLILDNAGQPVWFRPVPEKMDAMDFKAQRYRGKPVLTWWEGVHTSHGQGEYVLMDDTYEEVGRVRAANGYEGDHHEFLISPQGTALFTIYHPTAVDLSALGGPKEGATVLDGIVQEVDVESGEVLFEWHSLEHVGIGESYVEPYDYFHINSVEVDHDGNLLVSARNTWAVYKIDRRSGEVLWRLGGKKSDFAMGPGAQIRYQHHARRQEDGTITIFDNGDFETDDRSYGLVLELDEEAMSAELVREYPHPEGRLAGTQGSMQVLPGGNVFVGWGSGPLFSEFDREGNLLFNAGLPPESESYRTFRFPWRGRPRDEPVLAAQSGKDEKVTLYVSWNGATEVETWEVLAGPRADRLRPVASVPRKGFETEITLSTPEPYVGARAKDGSGEDLSTIRVAGPIRR